MAYADSIISSIMDNGNDLKLDNSIFSSTDFTDLRSGINNVASGINYSLENLDNSLTNFTNFNKELQKQQESKDLKDKQNKGLKELSDTADRKEQEANAALNANNANQADNNTNQQTNTIQQHQQQTDNNVLQQDLNSNQTEQQLEQSFNQEDNSILNDKIIASDRVVERDINQATNGLGEKSLTQNINTKIDSALKKVGMPNFSKQQIRYYIQYPNTLTRDADAIRNIFGKEKYEALQKLVFDNDLVNAITTEREINELRESVKEGILPYSYHLKIAQEIKDENPYKYRNTDVNELAMKISNPNDMLTGRFGKDGYKTKEQLEKEKQNEIFRTTTIGNAIKNDESNKEAQNNNPNTPVTPTTPTAPKAQPNTNANNKENYFKDKQQEAKNIVDENSYTPIDANSPENVGERAKAFTNFSNNLSSDSGLEKTTHNQVVKGYKDTSYGGLQSHEVQTIMQKKYPGYSLKNSIFGRIYNDNKDTFKKLNELQENRKTTLVVTSDGNLSSNSVGVLESLDMEKLEEIKSRLEKLASAEGLKDSDGKDVVMPQDVEDAEIALNVINSTIAAKNAFNKQIDGTPVMQSAYKFNANDNTGKRMRLNELRKQADEIFAEHGNDAEKIEDYLKLKSEIKTLESSIYYDEKERINVASGVPLNTELKDNYLLHTLARMGDVDKMYINGEEVSFGKDVPNTGSALMIWGVQRMFNSNKASDLLIQKLKSGNFTDKKINGDLEKLGKYIQQKEIKQDVLTDIITNILNKIRLEEDFKRENGLEFQPRKSNGLLGENQNPGKSDILGIGISNFAEHAVNLFGEVEKRPWFFADKYKADKSVIDVNNLSQSVRNAHIKEARNKAVNQYKINSQQKELEDKKAIKKK